MLALKYQRFLAMLFLGTALSLLSFWWQYYQVIFNPPSAIFQSDLLIQASLEFKRWGFWLESSLACLMLLSSICIWFRHYLKIARILGLISSLTSLVLGSVYLFEGFRNGLYLNSEQYISVLLTVDISLVVVGLVGLVLSRTLT